MYLHEEYITRYNLDIPIILFNRRSTVLLKSKQSPLMWRILAFSWREPDKHPGFFEVTYSEALHNGCERDSLLLSLTPMTCPYWDEYEETVLEMVAKVKRDGFSAVESSEQLLALWAIFLMMYDSWLARNMDASFFHLVELSLRSDLDISEREHNYVTAYSKLLGHSKIQDTWSYQLHPLTKTHSDWLVKLIND